MIGQIPLGCNIETLILERCIRDRNSSIFVYKSQLQLTHSIFLYIHRAASKL